MLLTQCIQMKQNIIKDREIWTIQLVIPLIHYKIKTELLIIQLLVIICSTILTWLTNHYMPHQIKIKPSETNGSRQTPIRLPVTPLQLSKPSNVNPSALATIRDTQLSWSQTDPSRSTIIINREVKCFMIAIKKLKWMLKRDYRVNWINWGRKENRKKINLRNRSLMMSWTTSNNRIWGNLITWRT